MPTQRIHRENENLPHFVTITVFDWLDIFTKKEYYGVLINCLIFCRENLGLLLYEYVLMTNHVHLIVAADEGRKLSKLISSFKKRTTMEILFLLRRDKQRRLIRALTQYGVGEDGFPSRIWQRDNFPEVIIATRFLKKHIEYIYNNPVKSGYVAKPHEWVYSSARNRLFGDNSLIELDNIFT